MRLFTAFVLALATLLNSQVFAAETPKTSNQWQEILALKGAEKDFEIQASILPFLPEDFQGRLARRHIDTLVKKAKLAFTTKNLMMYAEKSLKEKLTQKEAGKVVTWLNSEPGKRVLAAESDAFAKGFSAAYKTATQTLSKVSKKRKLLNQELAKWKYFTTSSTEIIRIYSQKLEQMAQKLQPSFKPQKYEDPVIPVDPVKLQEQGVEMLYGELTDKELITYIKFVKSPVGKKFLPSYSQSIDNAFKNVIKDLN